MRASTHCVEEIWVRGDGVLEAIRPMVTKDREVVVWVYNILLHVVESLKVLGKASEIITTDRVLVQTDLGSDET